MSINLLKLLLKAPRKMPGNMAHWFARNAPEPISKVGVRKIGKRGVELDVHPDTWKHTWDVTEDLFDPASTYKSHNPISFLKEVFKGRKVPYPSKASMEEGVPFIRGEWKTGLPKGQITRKPWGVTRVKGGGPYTSGQKGFKKAERELKSLKDFKEDFGSIINTAANRLVGKPKGLGRIEWDDPRFYDDWASVLEKVEPSDSVARQLNLLKKLGVIPAGGASMYGLKKILEGDDGPSATGFRDAEAFYNLSPLDKLKMILTVPNRMYGGR